MVFLGLFVAAEVGVEVCGVEEGVAETTVLVGVEGRTEAVIGDVGVAVWEAGEMTGRVETGLCAFGVMVGTGMERLTSSVDKRSLSFPVP